MTNQISGYSHTLFSGGSYLRRYAEEADKKENGGNGNGVIDGNEIQKFKSIVKQKTGYNFDFSGMSQVGSKTIKVQDNEGFLFNNTTEIAKKYGNATSTKTIDWMNNKQAGKDLLVPSRKTLDIPYMSDDDYKKSKSSVDTQEQAVRARVQKQNEQKRMAEARELNENCKSCLEIALESAGRWLGGIIGAMLH